jgi:hypothetical protein
MHISKKLALSCAGAIAIALISWSRYTAPPPNPDPDGRIAKLMQRVADLESQVSDLKFKAALQQRDASLYARLRLSPIWPPSQDMPPGSVPYGNDGDSFYIVPIAQH